MRYLKIIGLATMAALMASVMFASAAQAQQATLTAGETPETHLAADITAEQYPDPWEEGEEWNFFQIPEVEDLVRCDTSTLSGTSPGTTTHIKVDPSYTHCNAGAQAATVDTAGCEYLLTDPTTIEPPNTGRYTGTAHLTCPEGDAIVVTVYLFGNATETTHEFPVCTIEVTPVGETVEGHVKDPLGGHVIYQNINPSPAVRDDDLTVAVTIEGINVKDNCHEVESEEGVYKQTLTVKAFEQGKAHTAENQLDLWLSHE